MMNNDGRIRKLNRVGKNCLQMNEEMSEYCNWHYCLQSYSSLLNNKVENSVINSKIIDLNPSRQARAFARSLREPSYAVALPDFITEDNIEEFLNGNY